jgi:hypothetical protein
MKWSFFSLNTVSELTIRRNELICQFDYLVEEKFGIKTLKKNKK